MLRVGLTGGIGSGKSTAARIFEIIGVPVYYADSAARRLMSEDPNLRNSIISAFGSEAFSGNNLNKVFLSNIVFNDPAAMAKLNAIVHPAVLADAKNWLDAQTAPYAIKEAALIFEAGSEKDLDLVIGISAPLSIRIKRVMQRDKIEEAEVLNKMSRQMDEDEKMKRCDYVLKNDEVNMLTPQILELHKILSEKAGQS